MQPLDKHPAPGFAVTSEKTVGSREIERLAWWRLNSWDHVVGFAVPIVDRRRERILPIASGIRRASMLSTSARPSVAICKCDKANFQYDRFRSMLLCVILQVLV
jgi:hypothetical protein